MTNKPKIYSNNAAPRKAIKLSIVTPFLGDNPSGWIEILAKSPRASECEIILIDDGTNNPLLTNHLRQIIEKWPGPAILISGKENHGRSRARNFGIDVAKGEYVLFVDADMVPAFDDYLEKYFSIIDRKSAAIAFGGFVTHEIETNVDTVLHHNLSQIGDCRPLSSRKSLGAYAIATNNLLVRRSALEVCRFDDNFKGWGWEDTEWGLRAVAHGFGLVHIDNPAVHSGLDTNETMLRKYREAGPNLAFMLEKHPIVARFPAVKIAFLVAKIPLHGKLRKLAAALVVNKSKSIPIVFRRLAIKYWRASWAAEALKEKNLLKVN